MAIDNIRDGLIVVGALAFAFVLVVFAIGYQSTPTKIDNITITISEKYPTHSYTQRCGGGKAAGATCTYTDPATIIDDKGNLYVVENENDWAKMQINKTYNVRYASYPNAQKGKIIGFVGE